VGTIGPRKLLELLLLTKQAGFEAATSPIRIRALSWVEVTRTFTTPETFCRGNQRRERFALPLSYSGFRRRRDSNPQPFNEVARAFTTLQSLRREAANRAFFQCAPGASANLSAAGFEPVTSRPLAFEGTLFFTTPQTLESFSSPPYFAASYVSSRHTRRVAPLSQLPSLLSASAISGRNHAHGVSGFEPESFGPIQEVTVNFTIPKTRFEKEIFTSQ